MNRVIDGIISNSQYIKISRFVVTINIDGNWENRVNTEN